MIRSLKDSVRFKAIMNNIQFHVSNAGEWKEIESVLGPDRTRALKEILRARVKFGYQEMNCKFAGVVTGMALRLYADDKAVLKARAVLEDGETYDD